MFFNRKQTTKTQDKMSSDAIPEDAIASVVDMGFGRDQAVAALKVSREFRSEKEQVERMLVLTSSGHQWKCRASSGLDL